MSDFGTGAGLALGLSDLAKAFGLWDWRGAGFRTFGLGQGFRTLGLMRDWLKDFRTWPRLSDFGTGAGLALGLSELAKAFGGLSV